MLPYCIMPPELLISLAYPNPRSKNRMGFVFCAKILENIDKQTTIKKDFFMVFEFSYSNLVHFSITNVDLVHFIIFVKTLKIFTL